MNKINPFEGLVISSEDLKYIQSSIEEYFVKALSITSNFPETNGKGGVALGFNVMLSGTKVQVFNNNSMNVGYAMDCRGRIIEFKPVSINGVFLTPDNYDAGQVWVVAVKVVEEFGSYNPDTQGIDIGVKNRISLVESIPGESGGTHADRIVQEYKIDVLSDTEFAKQQAETGNAWIELGRFKTNGRDPVSNAALNLSNLDTSGVLNIAGRFTQGSVTINQISNELLPYFKEILVNLDKPTIGYYVVQKNRGRFVDDDILLTKTNGDPIDLFAGEFSTPSPRILIRRDGSFDSSPVGISDQFGNPVFSHTFTVTPENNFGMTYNPTLTAVSLYIGTLDFLSPGTSIQGRILDSNQTVIADFSTSVNNLVAQSWNKFQLSSTVVLTLGNSYTLQVRKSDSNSGFSLYAQNGVFAYRIWHRPLSGTYGTDVKLYDEFGDLTQVSDNNLRHTAKGIVRYIPYAAIINDFDTFSPYVGSEEEIDEFSPISASDRKLKFVAIDVKNGRFFFQNGQAPTEDVLVKCSFKQLLFGLSAARIQRKSQSEATYFESIESALLRLERLSNPEILVRRRGSPLVKVLPNNGGLHSDKNKFRFISTDSFLKDGTGTPFSEDSVNMPDAQLKIDAYNNIDLSNSTPTYTVTENYQVPRKALINISYQSLAGPNDGDRIQINGKTYEFDDNSSVLSGNIPVQKLSNLDNTFSQLVSKINASDQQLEASLDTVNKKVVVAYKQLGAQGNTIVVKDLSGAVPTRYVFLDHTNVPVSNPSNTTLSGGTWGSIIPFKPRFTKHTGVILFLKKTGNPTNFGSITVDLYAGNNYTETNINNLIKIGPTGRITSATVDSLIPNTVTAVFVNLSVDLDFNLYTEYYYKIKTDAVPVGGTLELRIDSSTSLIGFQQLFTSSPGLATTSLGYDIFDLYGSIFVPSPNRSPRVVESISQLTYTGLVHDFQVQSTAFPLQETGTESLPSFSPPTISDIYLSSIELLISATDTTAGEIIVTLHDENNQVVGVPQRKILPNPIVDPSHPSYNPNVTTPDLDYPTPTPGIRQSDHEDPAYTGPRGPVKFVIPYPAILDIRKRYHVHVQTTSISGNIFIGTNGTSGTGDKYIKLRVSQAYVPIYADLSDNNWENIVLPNEFYVAIDHRLGRIKFNDNVNTGELPPGGNLTANFNISIPFNALSSETIIRPDGTSVEDALNNLSSNINLVNDYVGEKVHESSIAGVYSLHSRDVALTKRGIDSTVPYLPSQVGLQSGQEEILLRSVEAKLKFYDQNDGSNPGFPLTTIPVSLPFLISSDPHGSTLTEFPLSSLYLHVLEVTSPSGNILVSLETSSGQPVGSTVSIPVSSLSRGFENRVPLNTAQHIIRAGISYVIKISADFDANNKVKLVDDATGDGVIDYRLFYKIPSGYYGSADGNYKVYFGGRDVTQEDIKLWPMKYPLYGKELDLVPFIGNDKTVGFVENISHGGSVISLERYDITERKFFPFEEEILFCAPKTVGNNRTIDVISKKKPTRVGQFTVGAGAISNIGNIVTLNNHGFNENFLLRFGQNPGDDGGAQINNSPPGSTVYYISVVNANTFRLKSSPNGTPLGITTNNSSPATFEVITSATEINYREYSYLSESWSDAVLIYREPEWKKDINSISIRNGQNSKTNSYNKIFIALIPANGKDVYIADNYSSPFSGPGPIATAAGGLNLVTDSWTDVKLFIEDHYYGQGPNETKKYVMTLIKNVSGTGTLHYTKRIFIPLETNFSTPLSTGITAPTASMQNLDVVVTDSGYWFAAVLLNGSGPTNYKYSIVRGTDFLGQTPTVGTVVSTANYPRKTIPVDHNADEIGLNSPSGNEVGKDGWKVILGSGPLSGAFSSASPGDLAVWSELQQSWSFYTYLKFTGLFTNYSERNIKLLGISEHTGNYKYKIFPFSWNIAGTPTAGTPIELTEDAKVPLNYQPPKFYRKDLTIAFLGLNDSFTEAKTFNIFDRRMPLPQGKNNTINYIDPFKRFSGLGVDPLNSYVHFDYDFGKAITTDHTVSVNLQKVADDFILNPKGWSDWTDEMIEKQRPQNYSNGWFSNYKFLRLDRWGVYSVEETPYIKETFPTGGVQYEIQRTKLLSAGKEYDINGKKIFISDSVKNGYYALALVLFPEDQVELIAPYTNSLIAVPLKFLTNEYFYRTGISQGILLADVEKT